MVNFELKHDGKGGTDLSLSATKVKYLIVELPGWVPVLMALKGAVDFDVDLRNHDRNRTWEEGYVDN